MPRDRRRASSLRVQLVGVGWQTARVVQQRRTAMGECAIGAEMAPRIAREVGVSTTSRWTERARVGRGCGGTAVRECVAVMHGEVVWW